jgi:hypothetical protein
MNNVDGLQHLSVLGRTAEAPALGWACAHAPLLMPSGAALSGHGMQPSTPTKPSPTAAKPASALSLCSAPMCSAAPAAAPDLRRSASGHHGTLAHGRALPCAAGSAQQGGHAARHTHTRVSHVAVSYTRRCAELVGGLTASGNLYHACDKPAAAQPRRRALHSRHAQATAHAMPCRMWRVGLPH